METIVEPYTPPTRLPFIQEADAGREIAGIYEEIKQELQIPYVPNYFKAMAGSADMLTLGWTAYHATHTYRSLPEALVSMIGYTIATKKQCAYCSANNEINCRALGMDEQTLESLVSNLESVTPLRVRAIIDFAWQVANQPQSLTMADYDYLRDQGVTDEEILEIIMIAAMCVFQTVVSDALKIEVDPQTEMALKKLRG